MGRRAVEIALLLFALSFGVRLLLDLLFLLHFGWHAVNHVETWLYVGVLEGTKLTAAKMKDPTVWMLRAIGLVTPHGSELYAVAAASAALTALTASLIFLLTNELYDKKAAIVAGVTYSVMVEPLSLGLMGFTHDHLQLPVMVASMVLAVRATKSGLAGGLAYSAAYYLLVRYAAMNINDSINIGIAVTLLYVIYALSEYFTSKVYGRRVEAAVYPIYIACAVFLLLSAGHDILPPLIEGQLEAMPQGRMGSVDIIPLSLGVFWLRYNVLIFLLPYAALAAYRRKDVFGLSLTITGLMISSVMDRGTRISDLGVAMLAAYAIVDWSGKWKNPLFEGLVKRRIDHVAGLVVLTCLTAASINGFLGGGQSAGLPLNISGLNGFWWVAAAIVVLSALLLKQSGKKQVAVIVSTLGAMKADSTRFFREGFGWFGGRGFWVAAGLFAVCLALGGFSSLKAVFDVAGKMAAVFYNSASDSLYYMLLTALLPALLAAAIMMRLAGGIWNALSRPIVSAVLYSALAASSWAFLSYAVLGFAPDVWHLLCFFLALCLLLCLCVPQYRLGCLVLYSILTFTYITYSTMPWLVEHLVDYGRGAAALMPEAAYYLLFLVAGAMMLYLTATRKGDARIFAVLAVLLFAGVVVGISSTQSVEARKMVPDAEYEVLSWLGNNNRGGKILVAWDHGYMAEVLTGLTAVSTPNNVDETVHSLLWMPYRQSAVNLAKRGVRYVLINSDNFNVAKSGEEVMYRIIGGLVMTPAESPPSGLINRYAVYKLRHNTADNYFKLVRGQRDAATKVEYLLYEVTAEPTKDEMDWPIIGAIAANVGGAKAARVLASTVEVTNVTFQRTYLNLANESFADSEVREIMYPLVGRNKSECGLRAGTVDNRLWTIGGVLAYYNPGVDRRERVDASLVDARTDGEVALYRKTWLFRGGQKTVVGYSFEGVDGYGDYTLALKPIGGIELVEGESMSPRVEDVRFLEVYC